MIRRFRDLGMALEDDVKRVLQAPDVLSGDCAVVEHLERMERNPEQTQATVASLRMLLEGPRATPCPVEFRSVARTLSLAIRERVAT